MKKLFLLFIITIAFSAYCQNCFHVNIQKSDKEYKTNNFFFKTVIDNRADTGNILGDVYTGHLNIRQCASFKKNVTTTVRDFLQKTYPNKSAPPFLVKINILSIQEILTKNQEDTGRVNAEFEFYKYSVNNDLIYITTISKTIEDKYPDATYSHDNRLKRVILSSVSEFEKILKTDTANFILKISQEDLKKSQTKKTEPLPLPLKTKGEPFKVALQIQGYGGTSTKGIGIKVSSYFFLKKYNRIGIGPSLFWDYFTLNKSVQIPYNVNVNYSMVNAGLSSFIRVNDYIGITIDGFALFGKEAITQTDFYEVYYLTPSGITTDYASTSRTTSDFIGGFHTEQGIQFMRQEKKGVNAKLSLFETILSGTYLESDIGIKLSLGINF